MKNLTKNLQFHPKQLLLFTAFAVLIAATSVPDWGTFQMESHIPGLGQQCIKEKFTLSKYGLFNTCKVTVPKITSGIPEIKSCTDTISFITNLQLMDTAGNKQQVLFLKIAQYSAVVSITLLFLLMGFLGHKKYANTIFIKILYGLTILLAINTLVMYITFSISTITCVAPGAGGDSKTSCIGLYPNGADICLTKDNNSPLVMSSEMGGSGFILQMVGIILLLGSVVV